MAHNYVREWKEFEHLAELPVLEDLVFIGNPLEEDCSSTAMYTENVIRRLLHLKKLDGYPVIREQESNEAEVECEFMDIEEIDRLARYLVQVPIFEKYGLGNLDVFYIML